MTAWRFRARAVQLATVVVLSAMAAYCWGHLRLNTQMTRFLPTGTSQELSSITREFTDSSLTRTMIFNIRGVVHEDTSATLRAGRLFADALKRSGAFSWVESGVAEGVETAYHRLYFPRRYQFLSDDPASLAAELSAQGISRRIEALKQQLSQPSGVLVRNLAPRDPWGAFLAHVERLAQAKPTELSVQDGQFVTQDGFAVVFAGFEGSAFDSTVQEQVLRQVDVARRAAEKELASPVELEFTGVNRFAVDAETRIRGDVQLVSTLATVGVLALFVALFRSLSFLALALVPLLGGTLAATTVSLLVFGEMHAITVAFGAALVGVCVDYPIHYLNQYCSSDGTPDDSLRSVRPALLLGAGTTVMGLLGLAWTSFPGIREIAVFASVGVAFALALTVLVVPSITPRRRENRFLSLASERLESLLGALRRRGAWLWVLPVVTLVLVATAIPRLTWQNSMRSLTSENSKLYELDRDVRERVSATDSGQFVVSLGETLEDALVANDEAEQRLRDAKASGLLGDYQSMHTFLWSKRLQDANLQYVQSHPELAAVTRRALEQHGFAAEAFDGFLVADTTSDPLLFSDLMASPLASTVRSFVVQSDRRVAILTFLRGVSNPEALAKHLDATPNVHYFNQARLLDEAYVSFRQRTVEMVAAGAVVVLLLLFVTYRSWRWSLAAFVPAALGSVTTLAIIVHAGVSLNLFHVLISLLVLSMGVDYGVFLVETARDPSEGHRTGTALVSIVVAALSTTLSFGALAASNEPALRAIGQTAGLGVFVCLVLAPVALILSAQRERA